MRARGGGHSRKIPPISVKVYHRAAIYDWTRHGSNPGQPFFDIVHDVHAAHGVFVSGHWQTDPALFFQNRDGYLISVQDTFSTTHCFGGAVDGGAHQFHGQY
jgi:hypothetical protein